MRNARRAGEARGIPACANPKLRHREPAVVHAAFVIPDSRRTTVMMDGYNPVSLPLRSLLAQSLNPQTLLLSLLVAVATGGAHSSASE